MPDDQELEDFKTRIDLRAYAEEQGYALDRKESWRGSSVMRHGNGDKIIVKKDHDGHYVYFSVRDERDNGSIIDFVQMRRPCSLGQVRQALRRWNGRTPSAPSLLPALQKTSKNRLEVEKQFQRMHDAPRHPYLENERGLSPALLGLPRFAGRVRIDAMGNAVFPHFDQEGLCGYEIKNLNFTSFSRGGEKGLWFSRTHAGDNRLVLAESAIDALSHAQLFPDAGTRYASIGGQMNPRQPGLIKAAVSKMPEASQIIAAMDADEDGRKLAEIVRMSVVETGRPDLRFSPSLPEGFKDWNDAVRQRHTSFPTALVLDGREALYGPNSAFFHNDLPCFPQGSHPYYLRSI